MSPVHKTTRCPRCRGYGKTTCSRCNGRGEITLIRKGKRFNLIGDEIEMNPSLATLQSDITDAQDKLAAAVKIDDAKDAQIAALQKQIADLTAPKVVTLSNIQAVAPETLWYEARDASAPKTGPHGMVTIVPGSPATADFHPIVLASGHSDNCYNLRRLYPTLTPAQRAIMETATHFTISCDYLLDPLASVQAAELDYQIRKSTGVVINVGPQLLPITGGWIIRGFDYVKKDWVPLGVKAMVTPGKPIYLEIDATCDDKTVQFTQVIVDGVATPVTFSHPVSQSTTNQPYCNAAYQLDATKDAKPYKASINNFQVTFA
jgi:hypothetical protein